MSLSLAGAEGFVALPYPQSPSIALPLGDMSRIGEARRLAGTMGRRAGLTSAEASDLGIVVTEIASNAVLHAGGGELILRLLGEPGGGGVEMLCIDRGQGMANVAESSRDGHSTSGTMGTGLGAARRIAHVFDIHSVFGTGTVVLARIWAGGARRGPAVAEVAGVCLPTEGETRCGDAWRTAASGNRRLVAVADGLGHGEAAADAADAAMRLFESNASLSAAAILELIHAGLQSSRGAAVAVAEIDLSAGRVSYAGLGNVAARILTESRTQSLVSHHGIAGHRAHRMAAFEYPWTHGATLVMQSDGVSANWRAELWPGILKRDPALLAAEIYRDHARPRDDSTVVAFRPAP